MRIGIDAMTLCDEKGRAGAGIEHYTWSVLLALVKKYPKDEFVVVIPQQISLRRESILRSFDNIEIIKMRKRRFPFLSKHVFLPFHLTVKRIDLLFSPSGQLPYYWIGKSLVSVHDVFVYTNPEWFDDKMVSSFATKKIVPRSLERADAIATVSDVTQNALHELFPFTEAKTITIPAGVDDVINLAPLSPKYTSKLNGIEDMLLVLGTLEPRKNILQILHAFHRFLEMNPHRAITTRLVLAGKFGWKSDAIRDAISDVNQVWQKRAQGDVVQAVGYIKEPQKWALLARANALLFLSKSEGFGLPILEAMRVGTPIIASDLPIMREVGGDAIMYANPENPDEVALALAQVLLVPEGLSDFRSLAHERSNQFSWEKVAGRLREVMEEVVKKTS